MEPYRVNIFLRVLEASRKATPLTLQMAGFSIAGLQVSGGALVQAVRWTKG